MIVRATLQNLETQPGVVIPRLKANADRSKAKAMPLFGLGCHSINLCSLFKRFRFRSNGSQKRLNRWYWMYIHRLRFRFHIRSVCFDPYMRFIFRSGSPQLSAEEIARIIILTILHTSRQHCHCQLVVHGQDSLRRGNTVYGNEVAIFFLM